jgi:hypothetical protein
MHTFLPHAVGGGDQRKHCCDSFKVSQKLVSGLITPHIEKLWKGCEKWLIELHRCGWDGMDGLTLPLTQILYLLDSTH